MEKPLVNRVANSGLITLNLEDHFPEGDVCSFDLKDYLYMELMLKEKDFRTALKEHDWDQYTGKNLCIFCSSDAIIPVWAYMLVATYAAPFARQIVQGNADVFLTTHYKEALSQLEVAAYEGKRIVIKGCSTKPVPASAYAELARLLQPYAQSIMYGEPCSTVPIFKRPRKLNKG